MVVVLVTTTCLVTVTTVTEAASTEEIVPAAAAEVELRTALVVLPAVAWVGAAVSAGVTVVVKVSSQSLVDSGAAEEAAGVVDTLATALVTALLLAALLG